MTILNIIYVVAAVLVAFGASIFLHELGHFWTARRLGMKVEEFAIGFGPKMYSWNRDGIEYSVRWIPAGGFVKLPQMITSEALEGHADEAHSARAAAAQNYRRLCRAVHERRLRVRHRHADLFRRPARAGQPADYRQG